MGEDIFADVVYEVKREIPGLICAFTIYDAEGIQIFGADKQGQNQALPHEVGRHHFKLRIHSPGLLPGEWRISGELWNNMAGFHKAFFNKRSFYVSGDRFLGTGLVKMDFDIKVL